MSQGPCPAACAGPLPANPRPSAVTATAKPTARIFPGMRRKGRRTIPVSTPSLIPARTGTSEEAVRNGPQCSRASGERIDGDSIAEDVSVNMKGCAEASNSRSDDVERCRRPGNTLAPDVGDVKVSGEYR